MNDVRDPETYKIIGAAMEVHKILGCGFLEAVYQDALEIEFKRCNLIYQREVELHIFYKNEKLHSKYRIDFLCLNSILVELKALPSLTSVEEAIMINYLKASKYEKGLLINFGTKSLEYKRFFDKK